MKSKSILTIALVLMMTGTIFAQEKKTLKGLVELRTGTAVGGFLIGDRANINYYSFGGLFALYPFNNDPSFSKKMSLRVSYEKTWSKEYISQFPWGPSDKYQEYRKHLNISAGFDIIQKPRFQITLHGGLSPIYSRVFRAWSEHRCQERECVVTGHSEYQEYLSRWAFRENGGVAMRIFPKKTSSLFLGIDWTRQEGFWKAKELESRHKNSMVGIVGIKF